MGSAEAQVGWSRALEPYQYVGPTLLVDDSVVPKLDIGERLGSGPIGISIGIRYRVPTP